MLFYLNTSQYPWIQSVDQAVHVTVKQKTKNNLHVSFFRKSARGKKMALSQIGMIFPNKFNCFWTVTTFAFGFVIRQPSLYV